MSRELSITYGTVTVGGTSDAYHLDGFHRTVTTDGTAQSSIEFDVVVKASSSPSLAQACDRLEKEFRTPRLSLVVAQQGVAILNVAHSAASGGFNTIPSIRKIGDVPDSGRSRRYTMRVEYETPADLVGTPGLRESAVNLQTDAAGIRTVTISGTFTAIPGTTNARSRHDAAIAAHVSSILSGLGVTTSELIEQPVEETDYDSKTIQFQRRYRELVYGQGQDAANDDSDITDQSLVVMQREFSEEASPLTPAAANQALAATDPGSQVVPLAIFDLQYEARIRNVAPKAKYDSIRSWLLSQFTSIFSAGRFALTVEEVSSDPVTKTLRVQMTAEGSVRGNRVIRRTVTRTRTNEVGVVFRGAWTGNPLDFYIYRGHDDERRTTTVTERLLSSEGQDQGSSLPVAIGGTGNWISIRRETSSTPIRLGIQGSGRTLDLIDVTTTTVERRGNAISSGGGGLGPFGGEEPGGPIFDPRDPAQVLANQPVRPNAPG